MGETSYAEEKTATTRLFHHRFNTDQPKTATALPNQKRRSKHERKLSSVPSAALRE